MNTPGPATIFSTAPGAFRQNEHAAGFGAFSAGAVSVSVI
jgi:hypothetical protein